MNMRRSILAFFLWIVTLSSYAQRPDLTAKAPASGTHAGDKGKNRTVIYVSPAGSDTATGDSPDTARATLQGGLAAANDRFAEGDMDVTVRVLPGRYVGQVAETAGAPAGKRLIITAAGERGMAIFDGEGKTDTWLVVTGRVGQPANLVVSGLKIRRYQTAISMNGSRDKLDNVVSQVEIRKNVFEEIGQFSQESKPSTAVVRLVNADDNKILGNVFLHFRNLTSCSSLHAIYVAHNSTGNQIRDNDFRDGCGDAVRFRDTSSNNTVQDNRFEDAWKSAPISDWYCDASSRDDCTKKTPECPSVDNRLVNNQVVAHRIPNNGLTAEFGDLVTRLCQAPASTRRFLVE
jgi:hypothetical protein